MDLLTPITKMLTQISLQVTGLGGAHCRYNLHHQRANLAAGWMICPSVKVFAWWFDNIVVYLKEWITIINQNIVTNV